MFFGTLAWICGPSVAVASEAEGGSSSKYRLPDERRSRLDESSALLAFSAPSP